MTHSTVSDATFRVRSFTDLRRFAADDSAGLRPHATADGDAGASHTFKQHDIFVVEQGARCSWDSREHVKKVYAIIRPA